MKYIVKIGDIQDLNGVSRVDKVSERLKTQSLYEVDPRSLLRGNLITFKGLSDIALGVRTSPLTAATKKNNRLIIHTYDTIYNLEVLHEL